MERIDDPAGPAAADPALKSSALRSTAPPEPAAARLAGVALELAQAVARGDVSREQADTFLARLTPRALTRQEPPRPASTRPSSRARRGFGLGRSIQ